MPCAEEAAESTCTRVDCLFVERFLCSLGPCCRLRMTRGIVDSLNANCNFKKIVSRFHTPNQIVLLFFDFVLSCFGLPFTLQTPPFPFSAFLLGLEPSLGLCLLGSATPAAIPTSSRGALFVSLPLPQLEGCGSSQADAPSPHALATPMPTCRCGKATQRFAAAWRGSVRVCVVGVGRGGRHSHLCSLHGVVASREKHFHRREPTGWFGRSLGLPALFLL